MGCGPAQRSDTTGPAFHVQCLLAWATRPAQRFLVGIARPLCCKRALFELPSCASHESWLRSPALLVSICGREGGLRQELIRVCGSRWAVVSPLVICSLPPAGLELRLSRDLAHLYQTSPSPCEERVPPAHSLPSYVGLRFFDAFCLTSLVWSCGTLPPVALEPRFQQGVPARCRRYKHEPAAIDLLSFR